MISAIFKSNLPSFQYLFKDGMAAVFINGRFETSNESQVRELAAEVGEVGKYKSRHPYIFVDEDEQEIDSEALTPLEMIKLQAKEDARKELLAEQAAAILNSAPSAPVDIVKEKEIPHTDSNTGTVNNFAASLNNTTKLNEDIKPESNGTGIATTDVGARLANLKPGVSSKP